MKRRLLTDAIVPICVFFALLVPHVAGYVDQNPFAVTMEGPAGAVSCQSEADITATVRDATTAQPVAGQAVEWDIKASPSTNDRLSDRTTITNAQGKTKVTLFFGPVDGERIVRAKIAFWPATIHVSCTGATAPTPTPTSTGTPTPSPTQAPTPTAPPSGPATAEPTPTVTGVPETPGASSPPPTAATTSPFPTTVATTLPTATTQVTTTAPTPVSSAGTGSTASTGSGLDLVPVAFVLVLVVGAGGLLFAYSRR